MNGKRIGILILIFLVCTSSCSNVEPTIPHNGVYNKKVNALIYLGMSRKEVEAQLGRGKTDGRRTFYGNAKNLVQVRYSGMDDTVTQVTTGSSNWQFHNKSLVVGNIMEKIPEEYRISSRDSNEAQYSVYFDENGDIVSNQDVHANAAYYSTFSISWDTITYVSISKCFRNITSEKVDELLQQQSNAVDIKN